MQPPDDNSAKYYDEDGKFLPDAYAEDQRKIKTLYSVPARFRRGFDGLKDLKIGPPVGRCQEWAKMFDKEVMTGLYISGPIGTGKTALACAIIMEISGRGFIVDYWVYNELLQEIKASFDDQEVTPGHVLLKNARQADLLFLDDLGADRASEWTVDILCQIINGRYDDCKPILITSNYTGCALLSRLEKIAKGGSAHRIISRLCEMVEAVPIAGGDLRRRKKGART